tara:strand:- start:82 stop:885 length:804 start_codon:yes stop_codon:yes gene_type:complete
MKKLLLILICIGLFYACGYNESELTKENINGKVKEIVETNFVAKKVFGDIVKDGIQKRWRMTDQMGEMRKYFKAKSKYNQNGNLIEKIYFKSSEGIKFIYEYDKDGKKVRKYNRTSWQVTEVTYEYDDNDNIIQKNNYYNDNLESTIKVITNNEGKIIEAISFNDDSVMYEKVKYKYNDVGNVIESTRYSGDDFEKEWTFKHKYDNIGNLIEFIGYVNDIHEEKLKWEYKYDEKNNWIERLEYKYNRNSSYYKPSTITERKIQYYLK